jgi:hypothetical protein
MASNEIEILDSAATVEKVKKIAAGRALDRRRFLAAFGMTGVAAGAGLMSGCNATTVTVPETAATPAETSVLNFLLNIKYLEATFYSYIVGNADINATTPANSGVNLAGSGAITGQPAAAVTFTQQTTDLLNEIYFDEWHQVAFLQSLLGSAGVARPAIDLAAFGNITLTTALPLARLLEDVAVSAFAGTIPLLTTSNATYASQILGVESAHAGALRLINIQAGAAAVYIPTGDNLDVIPYDPGSAALALAGPTASGSFFPTPGGPVAASNTTTGIAYARTYGQTLAVLYGGPGAPTTATKGGFFPLGVNGAIVAA